ncbi:uncharacterized protein YbjT (DUF2867 family) [Catalinimonas alkaloidigena]|uniref:SDR family oxidoreductase n=1 Tax=Catalinimonas alkaloidigena TaxID=1075417 RepID=UPI0024073B56|nr:SDR family oxidoreductase [Catalinimonas alkaloidigena]MDF9797927.1 uncharacterized protein YbjT (DUF2867 family) [Catalinimonas alkaloidigena]
MKNQHNMYTPDHNIMTNPDEDRAVKVIVAGATGYLGRHILMELQKRKLAFKAITRNENKLREIALEDTQIVKAEVTRAISLKEKLTGASVLISAVGITRQKDGLTYMDVDYRANLNLLEEAKRAGIRKFIYISAIHGEQMRHLKIMAAKEKFVDALKASGLEYTIIRPNGFFSDMKDFLDMAKRGRIYLFGKGNFKLNPIHGADLAEVIIDAIDQAKQEIVVGGPDIFSQNEIAEMALSAYRKPVNIVHLPDWIRKVSIRLVRIFASQVTYGPIEFFLTMMGQDNIAPRYGLHRLKPFFMNEVDTIQK